MKIGNVAGGNVQATQPMQKPVVPTQQKAVEPEGAAEVREDVQTASANLKTQAVQEINKEDAATEELMKKSIEQANKTLAVYDKYIERTVHEKTHVVMYTVRDKKTNDVIAEFPPKKIQDMIAKMWELAGLFVDEKA